MNLVFDTWDESGNPIPNLIHLNKTISDNYISDPWILKNLVLETKNFKLQDVNSSDKFYYVIQHLCGFQHFIKNKKANLFGTQNSIKNKIINLSENVIDKITNCGLNIMFISPHESPENLEIFVNVLNQMIEENNWNASQFYIINNNSLIYDTTTNIKNNINFYKINRLLKLVGEEIKIKPTEDDIIIDKKFIFLCLNRKPHFHRLLLLSFLKNLSLLENDIVDWSLVIDYETHTGNPANTQSVKNLNGYMNLSDTKMVKDYLEIVKTKKLSYYEKNVDWFESIETYAQLQHLTIDSYKNSYINIVLDSCFMDNTIVHITEKSFKPFYYFQIPIFLASHNHVKMIREEYNFDLFDDLIDHSYDNEIDNVKRFHMVVQEIHRLSTMRNEIKLYYKNNINRILNNHYFTKEYGNKKIDENYFLNL